MPILIIIALLLLLTPQVFAADSGGGSAPAPAPAPAVSATAKPATTPTPTLTPTPVATQTTTAKSLTAELSSIREMIAAKNFTQALAALKIADKNFPNNADINNLLGYSARNMKQYKPANTYYAKALKIDPNHLGALEYQGELFVQTQKLSQAKKNLAKLKTLCGVNCEEYLDLKKAIGNT
jgi:tetratricopeptide (TPR) repeat protein